MHLTFTNKTVIITGGTRGIGASLVDSFLAIGAKVLFTGTKNESDVNIDILNHENNVHYHQLDLSLDESVQQFLMTVNKLDKIDVLINNAGVNKTESISEILVEDWDYINAVNLRGPFLLTRSVSERMKQQEYGKIINIASIFGVVSKEERAAYSSTKCGLIGFTKAVALDLAPFNVQVNAVSPGFVDTDLTHRILGQKNINQLVETIPQGRLAKPDEISKVILFLCSDQNTYITGQNVVVDGGFTCA